MKRWIRYAVRLGIRIRYLLLDRGYEDRKIRRYLAAQMRAGRIDGFVQPAVKNTTVKRHIIRCALSGRSTLVVPLDGYHLVVERVESVSQSDLEKLRALPPDILRWMLGGMRGEGKRLKNLKRYGETADEARERLRRYQPALRRVVDAHHAWYTTGDLWEKGLHRELYRGRWRKGERLQEQRTLRGEEQEQLAQGAPPPRGDRPRPPQRLAARENPGQQAQGGGRGAAPLPHPRARGPNPPQRLPGDTHPLPPEHPGGGIRHHSPGGGAAPHSLREQPHPRTGTPAGPRTGKTAPAGEAPSGGGKGGDCPG
ncbi:MAG: hypothetical protein Q6352_002295 [Candidatus Freyrarchaeum guaymaensis]